MRRGMRALVFVTLLAGATVAPVFSANVAWAAPQLVTEVDVNRVAVGDVVNVSVRLRDEAAQAQNLNPGTGFEVLGTRQSSEFSLGTTVDQSTVFVWTLRAKALGTYKLAPTFRFADGTVAAAAVRIDVTNDAPRRKPQQQQPDPWSMSPFAPFFADPVEPAPRRRERELPLLPDSFTLAAPRGSNAFLHATIDKKSAVVGEQITHAVYLYERHGRSEIGFNDAHEPALADFLKRPLLSLKSPTKLLGDANVGDEPWVVRLVTKNALFPLRTGKLTVGPMRIGVLNRPSTTRESETFIIDVTDAPMAGRPPGYLGDVGSFRIRSNVKPREVEAGGAVAVDIDVEGTGNVPTKLDPPETASVHWHDPTTHDSSGASDDLITSKRTFTFVVQLKKPGHVNLGAISLPYWDPALHAYQTLRAELGEVNVTGSAVTDEKKDDKTVFLESLPEPRAVLSSPRDAPRYVSDSRAFFALSLVPPFGFLLGNRSLRGLRSLRDRLRTRSASPERQLADKRRALRDHEGEPKEKMALAYALVEHAFRMRTGGSLRGSAASALTDEPALASWVEDYEARRFAPEGVSRERATDISDRALKIADAWSKS